MRVPSGHAESSLRHRSAALSEVVGGARAEFHDLEVRLHPARDRGARRTTAWTPTTPLRGDVVVNLTSVHVLLECPAPRPLAVAADPLGGEPASPPPRTAEAPPRGPPVGRVPPPTRPGIAPPPAPPPIIPLALPLDGPADGIELPAGVLTVYAAYATGPLSAERTPRTSANATTRPRSRPSTGAASRPTTASAQLTMISGLKPGIPGRRAPEQHARPSCASGEHERHEQPGDGLGCREAQPRLPLPLDRRCRGTTQAVGSSGDALRDPLELRRGSSTTKIAPPPGASSTLIRP